MGKRLLLDCTLRDGGYVNDWKFGHDDLVSVFERVTDAGVDIIEIGFLDDRRPYDPDRSIMPHSDCVEQIYGGLDRKQTMVVGMIDYGTCAIENIRPCSECFLDGIRVIFKKHLRDPALAFCAQLKELGYKVFAQLVSVTSYSDEEMLDLVRLANEVKPFAVSMVDTYGLMHQNNLQHLIDILDRELDPGIALGYHGHNNFQMGYANCITMLSYETDRDLLVDGSIYGMGKSAGNAPIELIAMYMNDRLGKHYYISQLMEAIDANVTKFYRPATWGYNLFYYLAASNDCHPNYVSFLMEKRTLSVRQIDGLLKRLEGEKKLLYDKSYIEELYREFQTKDVNDEADRARLKEALSGRKLLVMGPGTSMRTERERVDAYIAEHAPTVISINMIPDAWTTDYIFLTNAKRYVQLAGRLLAGRHSIIATSNVTPTAEGAFDYVLNFSTLMDRDAEFIDNSLIMLLKALIGLGVKEVALAGFDGYSAEESNYYNAEHEYDFVKAKADGLNARMRAFLAETAGQIAVTFVTRSRYEKNA